MSKEWFKKQIEDLDGLVACNVNEPSEGDLQRMVDAYQKERELRKQLQQELDAANEAIKFLTETDKIAEQVLLEELEQANAQMSFLEQKLADYEGALSDVLPYLKTSTDMPDAILAVMVSPSEQLRRAAADIELKDSRINRAREILNKWRAK